MQTSSEFGRQDELQVSQSSRCRLAHTVNLCSRGSICRFYSSPAGVQHLARIRIWVSANAAIGIYSAVACGMIALTGIVFSLTFVMLQFSAPPTHLASFSGWLVTQECPIQWEYSQRPFCMPSQRWPGSIELVLQSSTCGHSRGDRAPHC